MKKPFLYAAGVALYIVIIVFVAQGVSVLLKSQDGTFVIPMAVLSLFVLSAAGIGFLFLSEPLYLLVENRKREAVIFFGKIVGFFACFATLFAILALLKSVL